MKSFSIKFDNRTVGRKMCPHWLGDPDFAIALPAHGGYWVVYKVYETALVVETEKTWVHDTFRINRRDNSYPIATLKARMNEHDDRAPSGYVMGEERLVPIRYQPRYRDWATLIWWEQAHRYATWESVRVSVAGRECPYHSNCGMVKVNETAGFRDLFRVLNHEPHLFQRYRSRKTMGRRRPKTLKGEYKSLYKGSWQSDEKHSAEMRELDRLFERIRPSSRYSFKALKKSIHRHVRKHAPASDATARFFRMLDAAARLCGKEVPA